MLAALLLLLLRAFRAAVHVPHAFAGVLHAMTLLLGSRRMPVTLAPGLGWGVGSERGSCDDESRARWRQGIPRQELTAKDISYIEVDRWLGLFHEVVPKARAVACADCHGATSTRLDWKALGYKGDPMSNGGRKLK